MADMLVKLYDLPHEISLVRTLARQGITIRTAMPYEKHLVTGWVRNTFGNSWASECDMAFRHHPVSCFIATEAGQIIGFACHDSTCNNFFGPTGVAEDRRGQGIGKAMLLSCLSAMRAKGYAYAIIGDAGSTDFYVRAAGATPIAGSSPGIYGDRLNDGNNPRPLQNDGPGISLQNSEPVSGGLKMECVMDHIVLNVEDDEKMITFYVNILFLTTERLEEYRAGKVPFPSVRLNAHTIIDLFPKKMWQQDIRNGQGHENLNHFCMAMSPGDWHELVKRLKTHQVPIELGPVPRWGAQGAGTSIYFRDPEGTLIEARYYETGRETEKCLLES